MDLGQNNLSKILKLKVALDILLYIKSEFEWYYFKYKLKEYLKFELLNFFYIEENFKWTR